jgi:hypothetical protein
MITEATTKQVQSVTGLCMATGLRAPDVAACLHRLEARSLARRLGGNAGLWELSHDFVAREFSLLLSRLRPSPWSRRAALALSILFVTTLFAGVFGIPAYLENQVPNTLGRLNAMGWTIRPNPDNIQFEIADASLPPMKASANLFRKLPRPFRLVLQRIPGLGGLHYISDLAECEIIESARVNSRIYLSFVTLSTLPGLSFHNYP